MSAIHVFIISWQGQHNRAVEIAGALRDVSDAITIVYSDPEDQTAFFGGFDTMCRDNSLYWADKFQACLARCAANDVMLVIHADCSCDDWPQVVERCRAAFGAYADLGIWSPRLTGTPWRLERTRIRRIPGGMCSIVGQTDGLVFALSPALYRRMKQVDYSDNLYGLGIDWLFVCAAYAQGRIAIVDEGVLVRHSVARGYSSEEARAQKRAFLAQLLPEEKDAYTRLKEHMRKGKLASKLLYWLEHFRLEKVAG